MGEVPRFRDIQLPKRAGPPARLVVAEVENVARLLSDPVEDDDIVIGGVASTRAGLLARRTLRNRHGFLLRGLLRCAVCGAGMSASWTQRRGKVYRYYRCDSVVGQGAAACPVGSIPAGAIEDFIVERVRQVATTPEVIEQALGHLTEEHTARIEALAREDQRLDAAYRQCREEARSLLGALARPGASTGRFGPERLGELDAQAAQLQARRTEVREELAALEAARVGGEDVRAALALFVPIWEVLGAAERARIVRLLLKAVVYDGQSGEVKLSFYPLGIQRLAYEARAAGAAPAEACA